MYSPKNLDKLVNRIIGTFDLRIIEVFGCGEQNISKVGPCLFYNSMSIMRK
jgi:hypothetical protein